MCVCMCVYDFQSATIFSQPLEVREICPDRCYKACQLAVWSPICSKKLQGIVKLASALESGRYVARDIGKSPFRRRTLSREPSKFSCPRGRAGEDGIPGEFRREFPLLVEEISFAGQHRPRPPACPKEREKEKPCVSMCVYVCMHARGRACGRERE